MVILWLTIAEVCEPTSIAVGLGARSKASGALGCWLVLVEWEEKHDPISNLNILSGVKTIKAVKVDGDSIKPNTWYILKDGEFIEVVGS